MPGLQTAAVYALLNGREAVAQLMAQFGCAKNTAYRHVNRAARRKRHPDWRPPQQGGARPGSGIKPSHVEQVRALLESGHFGPEQAGEIAVELDCHPRTVVQALERLANEG